MNVISLPVKFLKTSSEDVKIMESLGLPIPDETIDGTLKVLKHAIMAYNEDSEGYVTLYLMGGDSWRIYLPFKQFEELLND